MLVKKKDNKFTKDSEAVLWSTQMQHYVELAKQ